MFQNAIFIFFISLFLLGCNNSKQTKKIVSESTGRLTHLLIVCEQQDWDGKIGKELRTVFSSSLDGLPNPEPIFTVNHLPTSVFSGFTKKNRLVIKINPSDSTYIKINKNAFARPQVLVELYGETKQDVISLIQRSKNNIIETFIRQEIKTRQSQIRQSLFDDSILFEKFGISMQLPTSYRLAKSSEDFVWLRSDLRTGTKDIVVYTVGKKDNENSIDYWVNKRDSIGQTHIPGPVKGTFMGTEERYDAKTTTTRIAGLEAKEIRGLWDMKNDVMSGPYLMYVIEDKKNKRYLVAEGYLYAPSLDKREYMLELEAILKSIKFKA